MKNVKSEKKNLSSPKFKTRRGTDMSRGLYEIDVKRKKMQPACKRRKSRLLRLIDKSSYKTPFVEGNS